MPSPLKPRPDLIEPHLSRPVKYPSKGVSEGYPQAADGTIVRPRGKQSAQKPEALDELCIVRLKWQGFVKQVFLGTAKRPGLDAARDKTRREIFLLGEQASRWADFLARAYAIFKKYGFTRVDL
jgi:hypothetical protein